MKLTEEEVKELQHLLCSWEDSNISDCEYCNKVGKILRLGKKTVGGIKRIIPDTP